MVLLRPADWDGCNLFRGGRIYGGSYNELEAYLYFCRCPSHPKTLQRAAISFANSTSEEWMFSGPKRLCCSQVLGFKRLLRAALEYLAVSGRSPNIIHLHEWQAST